MAPGRGQHTAGAINRGWPDGPKTCGNKKNLDIPITKKYIYWLKI